MFRLVVVDSEGLQRDCVAAQLSSAGMAVEVAGDLPTLLAAVDIAEPTIVLIRNGSRDASTVLNVSLRLGRMTKVVVYDLSLDREPEIVSTAEAGVAGLVLESESFEHLLAVLSAVSTGHARCSSEVSAVLLQRVYSFAGHAYPDAAEIRLTARESEIMELVAQGLTNQQIASRLTLSLPTVKNYVHRLLTKLGVPSRADLAIVHRAATASDRTHPKVSSTSEQSS